MTCEKKNVQRTRLEIQTGSFNISVDNVSNELGEWLKKNQPFYQMGNNRNGKNQFWPEIAFYVRRCIRVYSLSSSSGSRSWNK